MGEICGAVERIDIPAVVAARIDQSLLFAENIVPRKLLLDPLANQFL